MVASALVAAATQLPWHRSGGVERDGFALARTAGRLGVADAAWARLLVAGVFLLPFLAACVLLAVTLDRRRLAGLVACATGVVGLASSSVVLVVAGDRRPGPLLMLAVATTAVGCGLRLVLRREGPG